MRLGCVVRLTDDTSSVGQRQKLMNSVTALYTIFPNRFFHEALTYSSSTYIVVCSMKHNTSNAFTHKSDFKKPFRCRISGNTCWMKNLWLRFFPLVLMDGRIKSSDI